MEQYKLEKAIWTINDTEVMAWHDIQLYGFILEWGEVGQTGFSESDILFDIDYAFKWVVPTNGDKGYSFWLSPCTLIFNNIHDLKIDLSAEGWVRGFLEIYDIEIERKSDSIYLCIIHLQEGEFKFICSGMSQVVRKKPLLYDSLSIPSEDRGGISFSRFAVKI